MIVTATPDLVLDVLDAADPATQRAATAKLEDLQKFKGYRLNVTVFDPD